MTHFARRTRRHGPDSGYAMLSVIGFGTAIVLAVSAVGGYALQTMDSAGRSQGFNAAIQAAQAGVDDFVSKLNANSSYGTAPNTAWQPVAGSVDGDGASCDVPAAAVPPNCPQFQHSAVATATGYTVTSVGKSRGVDRTVQVTLKKRALTDYLYFSDIEAADPADGWAYPTLLGGAPANCGNPAWGASARPASGCKVPTWRGGDSTDGSRVHTDDVFEVVGSPTFGSRVTAAIATCATDSAACVRKSYDAAANPDYKDGTPSYADDLDMPANGLTQIAAAAGAGGCTFYGPTRIHFEGANKMRVWSPQTPAGACGGGVPASLLSSNVNVVVSTLNRAGICSLLGGVTVLVCNLLGLFPIGSIVQQPLSAVLSNNLLSGTGLLSAVNGLLAQGNLVDIPANGAIYVKDNALAPGDAIPDPTVVQCLLGSALGMYSTIDATITAGLLNSNGSIGSNCRAGKLFVDGVLDGKVTAGVAGDIVIMSNLTYSTTDNADNDRLGLVATGPVEVYNPLQCVLAIGTCLALQPLSSTLTSALPALMSAGTGNLTALLDLVPGYGDDVTIDASIISLQHRFGMQLPVLSLALNAALLNKLVNLNIDPPKLTLHGSLAQKYRGIISADLLNLSLGVPSLDLAGANVDIGYDFEMAYDDKLRTDAPLYLPGPDNAIWDPQTFAELDA